MTTYAFTFGHVYDLHDRYVLIEADSVEDATALFQARRRDASRNGGLDSAEFRWLDVVPFEAFKDLITLDRTEVAATTPINYRERIER